MTLGERLQQLRKEKQMSQEELGNLLLVSRQTVSLWENNQTVPTVDNLIRLKEIFGVSIDSILTGEEPAVSVAAPEVTEPIQQEISRTEYYETPIETYAYSVNKKDLSCLSKLYCTKPLRAALVFLMFFYGALAGSNEFMNFEPFAVVLFFGFFISLISYIRCLVYLQKVKKEMCRKNYACELYQNYILLKAYTDNNLISTRKIFPHEIKSFWNMPYCCFVLTKEKLLFPIKKSVFEELSYMGYFCNNLTVPKNDFRTKKIASLKSAASALFAGTFISFYTAIAFSVSKATESAGLLAENAASLAESIESFRIFHLFLPIPILSILIGIILNKNKIRNRKNIVVGIIIGLYMLIFGFAPAIFGNVENKFSSVESTLGFDFPECISFRRSTSFSDNAQTVTSMSFTESASNEFETTIKKDSRWSSTGRKDFYEILPESIGNIPGDLFLIYNVTTDEFGKLPDKDGKYEFIYIAYDTEMNTAYIFEYTADYQK